MTEHIKQACPLCGTPAEYYWVDMGNRKYYHCPSCTYFIASKRAENLLIEATQHVRNEFSAKPRLAPENNLFVILAPPQQKTKEVPHGDLFGSFVLKSEMRL